VGITVWSREYHEKKRLVTRNNNNNIIIIIIIIIIIPRIFHDWYIWTTIILLFAR